MCDLLILPSELKRINGERLRHIYGRPYFGGHGKSPARTALRAGKGGHWVSPKHLTEGRGPRNAHEVRNWSSLIFIRPSLCSLSYIKARASREGKPEIGSSGPGQTLCAATNRSGLRLSGPPPDTCGPSLAWLPVWSWRDSGSA